MSHQLSHNDNILREFENQVEHFSIRTPLPPICCGRKYVRVSKLSEWFQSKIQTRRGLTSRARCLLDFAYRDYEHAPLTTHKVFEGEHRCQVVFSILLRIGCGDLIHHFRRYQIYDSSLPIYLYSLKETLSKMIRQHKLQFDVEALAVAFDNEQWSWCPAKFERDEYYEFHRNRIIPILEKEEITSSTEDGPRQKGGTATLWQIAVLEEFVHPSLRDVLQSSMYNDENDQMGPRYCFALKVFAAGKKGVCDNEIEAFNNLRDHNGMVRYLGGFNHQESWGGPTVGASSSATSITSRATHNILLEFGDRDLDELFAQQLPPSLRDEIDIFWKGLFEIADAVKGIHNLKIHDDGIVIEIVGWHADIKPDNILEIQGKFKLADPGFARFKEKASGLSATDPTTNLRGGTHTFGAPERLPGMRDSDAVGQTIDIWSLGCVFSVAATWVALGYQGVKQYTKLRENALTNRIRDQESGQSPDTPKLHRGDYFHDGLNVLTEVKNWHTYLRTALKHSDGFTSQVLDLVEGHMLVSHSTKCPRTKASEICQRLSKIKNSLEDSDLAVPDDIVNFLLEVDEKAPTNAPSSASVETITDRAHNTFQERQARKEQHRLAPMMKTTGRSYLKSYYTPLAGVLEAAQPGRTKLTTPPPSTASPYSTPPDSSISPFSVENEYSQDRTNMQQNFHLLQAFQRTATDLAGSGERSEFKPKPEDFFQAREAMAKRKLETPKKEKLKIGLGMKQKPKDSTLAKYYEDRDIVFIVDNSESMIPHWERLKYLLETLVMKAEGLDEDGVNLVFSHGKVSVRDAKQKAEVQFVDKLKSPEAMPREGWLTDMKVRLLEILDDYVRYVEKRNMHHLKPKNMTVIVLTDGVWGGTEDKEDVYYSIVNFIKRFEKIYKGEISTRPVSIQFIQFGKDPNAIVRLRRLDDDMKVEGIPDLVDTEHCDGDVNKMLLGSFNWLYDELKTDEDSDIGSMSSPTGLGSQKSQDGSVGRFSIYSSQPPRTSPAIPESFVAPGPIPRRQTEQTQGSRYTAPPLDHHSNSDSTGYAGSSQTRNPGVQHQGTYRY